MSHRRSERDECGTDCAVRASRLMSAVQLISQLARDEFAHGAIAVHCDAWLERHGFSCQATRKAERERRAAELDAQIERLRAERAAL